MATADDTERWLPIPGYEGLYEVSDHGRVKSVERKTWLVNRWGQDIQRTVPERLRAPVAHVNGGHLFLKLHREGKRKAWFVHRLVLLAFVGEPADTQTEVRHIDGDPTNNKLANLAYGTHAENVKDMQEHGTHRNARKDHCDNGHPFDAANTYWRPDGKGRSCIACMRAHGKEYGAAYQREHRRRKRERLDQVQ